MFRSLCLILFVPLVAAGDEPTPVAAPGVPGGQVVVVPRAQLKATHTKQDVAPKLAGPVAAADVAPPVWDFTKAHTVQFPILGNDQYGCCFYAACCHLAQAYVAMSQNIQAVFDANKVVARYLKIAGGDNGLSDNQILPEFKAGIVGPNGPYKIWDSLTVDPGNAALIAQMQYFFGPMLWTCALPDAWINSYKTGVLWDVAPGNQQNGHAMTIDGRDKDGNYTFESWGTYGRLTPRALAGPIDAELIACASPLWFDKDGYTPTGFHISELSPKWQGYGGKPLPVANYPAPKPAPQPTPTPVPPPTPMPADLVLTAKDLNDAGLAKLKAAGLADFRFDLVWAKKNVPMTAAGQSVPSRAAPVFRPLDRHLQPTYPNGRYFQPQPSCPNGQCPVR